MYGEMLMNMNLSFTGRTAPHSQDDHINSKRLISNVSTIKGLVHPKMKMMSLMTLPQVVSSL